MQRPSRGRHPPRARLAYAASHGRPEAGRKLGALRCAAPRQCPTRAAERHGDRVTPAIMVGALNGVMLFWNPAAELLFGWSADEVVGHQLLDVEFNFPADSHRARMAVAAGDDVLEVEVRRRHRQGHMIRATMSTVGLRDPSGRVTTLLGIFREVPERKAGEEERVS